MPKHIQAGPAAPQRQVEVFFLPRYLPKLDPDEYLNCDLKAVVNSGRPMHSRKQLNCKTHGHIRKVQWLSYLVSNGNFIWQWM